MPCEGWQSRLDPVKASAKGLAQGRAGLALNVVKPFSTPHYQLLYVKFLATGTDLRNSSPGGSLEEFGSECVLSEL